MRPNQITTCADSERFVRGGPTLTTFFFSFLLVDEGGIGRRVILYGDFFSIFFYVLRSMRILRELFCLFHLMSFCLYYFFYEKLTFL